MEDSLVYKMSSKIVRTTQKPYLEKPKSKQSLKKSPINITVCGTFSHGTSGGQRNFIFERGSHCRDLELDVEIRLVSNPQRRPLPPLRRNYR